MSRATRSPRSKSQIMSVLSARPRRSATLRASSCSIGFERSGRLVGRWHWKARRTSILPDGFAPFGDGPGLAARRAAHIDDRPPQRVGFRRNGVTAWAREKPSGFRGVQGPFVHDSSTMPQPRSLHNQDPRYGIAVFQLHLCGDSHSLISINICQDRVVDDADGFVSGDLDRIQPLVTKPLGKPDRLADIPERA
jgi:hypothetical protein